MKNFYNYNLLIENYADLIKSTIEKNKTVIIKGPTGCGKSTYVPLLLDFNNKKIAIIEPRRIAVTSLYNILSPVINKRVGYKMRFNKKLDKDTNMIIYTDGAFFNDIQYKEFDYIILDEVHERSIRTDVILSILKKLKSKVILMSATVDTIKIQKYCDAKVIEIEGVSYPVKIIHNEEPVSDYLIEAYTIIKGIVLDDKKRKEKLKRNFKNKNKQSIDDEVNEFLEIKNESEEDYIGNDCDGEDYGNKVSNDNNINNNIIDTNIIDNNPIDSNKDILVFLTGEEDINELYKLLKRILNIQVFKIYSSLSDSEQSKIFEDSPLRKVILSTNICETSLTIPGIKYVIDCGLSKTKIFDKIEYMGILAISKESEEQRTGRCNRTGPGICYRLYPKMKMLPLIPEIKRTDLSNCILQLTNFGINIFECEFLDYPPQTNVLYALKFLLKKKLINLKIKNGKNKYEIREESVCKVDNKFDKVDNNVDSKVECKVDRVDSKIDKVDTKVDKLNSLDNNTSYLLDNIFNLKIKIYITNYGKIINSLPFDVNLSCFYQDCLSNNVSYYGSILTAMISLNNYNFIKNVSDCDSIKNSKFNSTKSLSTTKPDTIKLNNSFKSDLEFLINLFEDFLNSENKFIYCKEKGVSQKFLEKASNIFHKLNKKKNDKNDILILEKVFSNSFSYNKSIKEKDGSYTHLESNRKVYIHPTSCYFKKSEKEIVFVDVLCTTKEYVRIVGKYYKG